MSSPRLRAQVPEQVSDVNSEHRRGPWDEATKVQQPSKQRIIVVGAVIVIGVIVALCHLYSPGISPKQVVNAIKEAGGVSGAIVYVAAFCLFELLHLPAIVVVAAGVRVWGVWEGWLLALLTAPVAISLPFFIIRSIGGRPLAEVQWPLLRRMMAKLDDAPLRTVALLRLVFFLSPPITSCLALSGVPFTQYLMGSVIGLAIPLTLLCLFLNQVLYKLGFGE